MTQAATATITLLFTDIVDSTALYDRLGADVTHDLRRSQFAVLRDAVAGHNGTEVKSTGDGLMVAFASAADAVECAVDMQRALAGLRRADSRVPLSRIGISLGEATNEDGDWYGPPVVEAARLCALADGDQILTNALVAMLVGSRKPDAVDFVDRGTHELKGFNTPVDVREVTWTADTAAVPLPYVVASLATGAFVGRDHELERLTDAWKRGAGLLLVAGEPGIGKTRAVAELAARAHADGAIVLWGRSDEDLGMPYQPFVEALRYFIDNAPDDVLAAVAPQPDLLRLVPELRDRMPGLGEPIVADAETERLRMFDATVGLLTAMARSAPVLLVLDDLHWATAPTLLLLRYLTRAGHQLPRVVIAATYRDTELDRAHPLSAVLAELRRLPGVERVALSGLDAAAVTELVEAAHGDAAVAHAVYDETEGNPFFVAEVLRHLSETGTTGGVPEGVREVIGHRLSRLSDEANRVLAVAAAVGPDVDLDVLEAIPDAADAGPVLDALEAAAAARLVRELPRPVGRFVFTHALVRQTLYAELSGARRARLHFRIAAAMESLGPDRFGAAALAHHYAEGAAAGGVEQAIQWCQRAAAEADERLAYEEAVAFREKALQLYDLRPDGVEHERLELLVGYGFALRKAGDIDAVRRVGAQIASGARAIGDVRLLSVGAVLRTEWGLAGIVDDEAEALVLEAIAAVDALGDGGAFYKTELLCLLAFYRGIYLGRVPDALVVVDEGLTLARAIGDDLLLGRALSTVAFLLQSTPDLERQQRLHDEFIAAARRAPERTTDWATGEVNRGSLEFNYLRHWPILELQRGNVAAFDKGIALMGERRGRIAGFLPSAFFELWSAMRALMDGRVDDAETASNRIPEITDDINFFNSWAAQMFAINRMRGTLASVRDVFVGAAEQTPGIVALQGLVALAAAECGDLDTAGEILDRLMADPDTTLALNSILPGALAHLTDIAFAVGSPAAAAVLLEHLLPFSGQLLVVAWGVTCEGAADRYIGMCHALLGQAGEARAYLERALTFEQRIGCPGLIARTEAALAKL